MNDWESLRDRSKLAGQTAAELAEKLCEAAKKVADFYGVSIEIVQQAFEELAKILQAPGGAMEKIRERRAGREWFRRNERAENARRAAVFKQYTRSAARWGAARRTRPRNRDFKPP